MICEQPTERAKITQAVEKWLVAKGYLPAPVDLQDWEYALESEFGSTSVRLNVWRRRGWTNGNNRPPFKDLSVPFDEDSLHELFLLQQEGE